MKSTKVKSKNGSARANKRFIFDRNSSNKHDSMKDFDVDDNVSGMSLISPKNLAQSFVAFEDNNKFATTRN